MKTKVFFCLILFANIALGFDSSINSLLKECGIDEKLPDCKEDRSLDDVIKEGNKMVENPSYKGDPKVLEDIKKGKGRKELSWKSAKSVGKGLVRSSGFRK